MKAVFCVLVILSICSTTQTCNGQLLQVLNNSPNLQRKLYYIDTDKNYYKSEFIDGAIVPMEKVIFTKVRFIKNGDFLIEGITVMPSFGDTLGLCCVEVFLGKTIGDSIYNKRSLGRTNSKDDNPNREHGYFSFLMEISKGDKLFFCVGRGNLKEYFIDRLLSGKKE